jgi:hypothetical protein
MALARRSLLPITVDPELTAVGGVLVHVVSGPWSA